MKTIEYNVNFQSTLAGGVIDCQKCNSSQDETKTFQAARFTFFMSTFLARLSSNLMEFRSFFSLSENRLSWSAEVPWRRLV